MASNSKRLGVVSLIAGTALAASLQTSAFAQSRAPAASPPTGGDVSAMPPANSSDQAAVGTVPATTTTSQVDNGGLADIVVTAQRRSENLQNVPVTVTALSGTALAARGVTDVKDLNVVTPGLQVSRLTGATSIYLRGVGNNNSTAGQEQNVAIYVDGVYYPAISADLGAFQNVVRIEVLKGPQGTLFGRNATGGLIQVITKDPSHTLGGAMTAGYSNYNTVDATGYLTGGITSTLAADVAVDYHRQSDGWGRNVTTGQKVNKSHNVDVRSKLLWEPTSTTKVTTIGAYTEAFSDVGDSQQLISTVPIAALGGDQYSGNLYNATQNETGVGSKTKQVSGSLKIEQDLGFARLMSLSAYQNTRRNTFLDLDKSKAPRLSASFPDKTKSFSQEIQLSSDKTARLKWIAGVFYFYENGREDPLSILVGPTHLAAVSYNTGQKTQSVSGYAQATYAITDTTNVTAGGRYTYDHKELYGCETALGAKGYVSFCANDATRKRSFTRIDYKAEVDHHFTSDVMLYGSVSTGFKSGVYNITFTSPAEAPVNPEKLTSIEGGLKTELMDKRVRFNLTGFYYDYKDIQLQTYVTTAILLINAASAKVYGGEAELQAQVTRELSLSASGSLIHSAYGSFLNAPHYDSSSGIGVLIPINATGFQLIRSPDFTVNASADYTVPTAVGPFNADLSFYHTSSYAFEVDNRLRQSAYDLVNASLAWTSNNGHLNARAFAKNLFDRKYVSQFISGNGSPDVEAPAAPRTYGVVLGLKF